VDRKGQTYAATDIARWAKEAGLSTAIHVEASKTGPSSHVIVDKPL
jgi:hypothetical protein